MKELPKGVGAKGPQALSRVDADGRAFAGSQLQVQIYVNRRTAELNRAICAATGGALDADRTPFEWVAPLEAARFREYRDGAALRELGLAHLRADLAAFWPARGPRWDGLARVEVADGLGIVLVEGKSYPREVLSGGSRAGASSRRTIERAMREAKAGLGVPAETDWLGSLYQSANRLAHLYFFRKHGASAWLVNLNFIGDEEPRKTSLDEWRAALPGIKRRLFGREDATVPYVLEVFLPALQRGELVHGGPA